MWTTAGSPDPPTPTGLLRTTEVLTTCLTRAIPAAVGASLLVKGAEHLAVGIAATDPVVAWADALQTETGQGPGLDVLATGRRCRSHDLVGDRRWPSWGRRLRTAGLPGVAAAAVWDGSGRCVAALQVYTAGPVDEPGAHLERQLDGFGELLSAAAGLTGRPLADALGVG